MFLIFFSSQQNSIEFGLFNFPAGGGSLVQTKIGHLVWRWIFIMNLRFLNFFLFCVIVSFLVFHKIWSFARMPNKERTQIKPQIKVVYFNYKFYDFHVWNWSHSKINQLFSFLHLCHWIHYSNYSTFLGGLTPNCIHIDYQFSMMGKS